MLKTTIIQCMRIRALPILIASILLLASCSSTQEADFSSLDESQAQLILIRSEQSALMTTENETFLDLEGLPLPSSYSAYISELAQFNSALEDYLASVKEALGSALADITDLLLARLEAKDLASDVYGYFTRGYSSLSDELRLENEADVLAIVSSHLASHAAQLDRQYALMDREARIWRENQANLSLVGQGRTLASIAPLDMDDLARWAVETYFDTLSRNEVVQRSRMVVEGAVE